MSAAKGDVMIEEQTDPTEGIRRTLAHAINAGALTKEQFAEYGIEALTTEEVAQKFEIIGFAAPLVIAHQRTTGERGSLYFQHHPRLYFAWEPESRAE